MATKIRFTVCRWDELDLNQAGENITRKLKKNAAISTLYSYGFSIFKRTADKNKVELCVATTAHWTTVKPHRYPMSFNEPSSSRATYRGTRATTRSLSVVNTFREFHNASARSSTSTSCTSEKTTCRLNTRKEENSVGRGSLTSVNASEEFHN